MANADQFYHMDMKCALIGILLLSTTTAFAQESTIKILRPPQANGAPTTSPAPNIRTIIADAQKDCFNILKGDPGLPKGADGANSLEKVMAFNWCMDNIKRLLEQHEIGERVSR